MFKQKLRLAENVCNLADRAGDRLNAKQKILNADFALNKKKRVPKYSQNHHREEKNSFIVFAVVYNCNNLDDDISLRNLVDQ